MHAVFVQTHVAGLVDVQHADNGFDCGIIVVLVKGNAEIPGAVETLHRTIFGVQVRLEAVEVGDGVAPPVARCDTEAGGEAQAQFGTGEEAQTAVPAEAAETPETPAE